MTSERNAQLFTSVIDLADTLVSGFDVIDLADQLVAICQDLLDIAEAGIMLDDQRGGMRVLASTSEGMRMLELLELEANEGPCLEAFRSGARAGATDLTEATERWPRFAPAALARGFTSAYALPMRLRQRTIGALNLFATSTVELSEDDLRIGEVLASMATIGLMNHQTLRRQELLAEQLQTALNSRVVIEQAKGILAQHAGIDMDAAFTMLRSTARTTRQPLTELAARLASGSLDPAAFQDNPTARE